MEQDKTKSPLILIVDDDEDIVTYLSTVLNYNNYRVITATDGKTAITETENQHPDLILLDINLPKKDGREVCRILKSNTQTKYIPIIMITAQPDNVLIEESYESGADEFIRKPFETVELLTRVKAMLRIKSLHDELSSINEQLQDKIDEKKKQIHKIYIQTVKTLAATIDAKDHYTYKHSLNVSRYAVEIARRMGLSEQEILEIQEAAELHDIGKISIPDSVLSKTEKLNEEDWSKIKKHPVISAEILESLLFLNNELGMIEQHHERYDGLGYPYGNREEKIPLGARIIAVADAYEAMTSDRPYRKALTKEEAIAEIQKNKGKQFDPEIVDIFLNILKENES